MTRSRSNHFIAGLHSRGADDAPPHGMPRPPLPPEEEEDDFDYDDSDDAPPHGIPRPDLPKEDM